VRSFNILQLATVLGIALLALVAVTPPLTGTDEATHLMRVFAVSRGEWFPSHGPDGKGLGGVLPESLVVTLGDIQYDAQHSRTAFLSDFSLRAPDGRTKYYSFPTAELSPVGYAVPAVAVRVGRAFGASPLVLSYLARLACALEYLACAVLAMLAVPSHRFMIAVLSLSPALLFLGVIVSPDALTAGLILLASALALRTWRQVSSGEHAPVVSLVATLGPVAALLAAVKPPYFVASLVLLLPLFARPARRVAAGLCAIVASALAVGGFVSHLSSAAWRPSASSPFHSDPVSHYLQIEALRNARLIHPNVQTARLRHDPGVFISAVAHTVSNYGGPIARAIPLSYGLWPMPFVVVLIWVAGLLLARSAAPDQQRDLPTVARLFLLAVVAVVVLLVLVALFVYTTPSNASSRVGIFGVQGRHLSPLLPLLFLAVPASDRLRRLCARRNAAVVVMLVSVAVVAATCIGIVSSRLVVPRV
jgi:uncharacterized membrane protein